MVIIVHEHSKHSKLPRVSKKWLLSTRWLSDNLHQRNFSQLTSGCGPLNKSVGSNKQFPHWDSIAGSLYMLHMDMELVWVPVAGNMLPSNPCKTSAYKRKQFHLVLSVCICLFLYIYFFISYYFLFIISHFSITLNMFDGFSYQGWSTSVRICQSSFAYFPLWPYIWN